VKRRWLWVLIACVAVDIACLIWWRDRREHRYDTAIREAARRYGLPPALVKAVVWRESRFDAGARGRAGEVGLMQLMDFTAQEWADNQHLTNFVHEQAFDPVTNTLAGSFYLAKAMRRYPATDNPYAYALADYNAGRGNVLKWMKGAGATNSEAFLSQMEFPGTRSYVQSILERYEKYRAGFN
jgi:soluble lytic murein transglycosylase